MGEPEHIGVEWELCQGSGWAQFVAARRRYLSGRAWDSLVWRLERTEADSESPVGQDRGEEPDAGASPAAGTS